MPDNPIRDWLPAIAIVGPILSALITALVTWRFRERTRVRFTIGQSEDLAAPLTRHRRDIAFRIGDQQVQNFNRGIVISIQSRQCYYQRF
jgi:hypothetical protein